MVQAYKDGKTKYQVGLNDNLFDFTYVENVAYGHVLAVLALLSTHKLGSTVPIDTERVDGEAFFITNGEPVYFWDFARAVWHEAGDRLPPDLEASEPPEAPNCSRICWKNVVSM